MKKGSVFLVAVHVLAMLSTSVSGVADDYFDYITVFSEGRVTRFVEMPIKIYIAPTPTDIEGIEAYPDAFRYAMHQWEMVADGHIQFQESPSSRDADIRVSWQESRLIHVTDTALGRTGLTRFSEDSFEVEILLSLREHASSYLLSPEKMRTVCLHELGHAIGLWGHSPDKHDVTFSTATAQTPTARDRQTLLKVYATPLHTPQHDTAIGVIEKRVRANPTSARNHYLLGNVYFDKGDTESAITHFNKSLTLDTNLQEAKDKLLEAYQKIGSYQDAIDLLERILGGEPSADAYNLAGVMYYKNREIDMAIEAFRKSLYIHPHYPAARKNLHQLYREKGMRALKAEVYPEAASYFSKALQFNPLDTGLYRLMGDAYATNSDFQNAIAQYQKALDLNPVAREIRDNLARHYSNYGVQLTLAQRWEEAIEAYRQALQLLPNFSTAKANLSDVYWRRANVYRQAGKLQDAINAYQELLDFDPNESDVHSLLGELHLEAKNYRQAIAAFQVALAITPSRVQARKNLVVAYHKYGQVLDSQNRYSEAIAQLRSGITLAPEHVNLRLSLAHAYQHAGDFDSARGVFEEILQLDPNNSQGKEGLINQRIQRGNDLMRRQQYAAALAEFEAIPQSKRNAEIYNAIGYLHLVENRLLESIFAFEAAIADNPMDAVSYRNLLHIESRFYRQLNSLNNLQDVKNHLARVQCVLVICLIGREEYVDAEAKYRAALKLNPTDTSVKAALTDVGRRHFERLPE